MAGETILVVEDEAIIAFNLQRILSGFGYQVPETVESGQEAIRAVEHLQPDLVLMDIQLHGDWDGIETARRINSMADLPVVYLTAYAEDSRLARASQTAPYGYLVKPVQDRELRATIQMALVKGRLDRTLKESESAYRNLYHNTPAMLHTTGPDGRILQVSDFWLSTLGYRRDEVIGCDALNFVHPDSRSYIQEKVNTEFRQVGAIREAECQYVCKNGRVIDVHFSTIGVFAGDGSLVHILTALVDITARKQAEAAERDQRTLAEALRDTASALTSTLGFNEVLERILTNVGKVVPYNAVNIMLLEGGQSAYVERSHGYRELGLVEEKRATLFSIDELPQLRAMAATRAPVMFPDTLHLPSWQPSWARSYAGAPMIFQNRLVGFINLMGTTPNFFDQEHASRLQVFADQAAIAIENARLYQEVERLATLDDVTGIFNRRRLFDLGRHEFERARRYPFPLAAILLDLDRFKKINDTYGHTTGDRVLAGIASAISRNIRTVDIFGRYGGEEFVVLLPNSNKKAAVEVAERLRSLVAGLNFETDRGPLFVTISVGVAMLSPNTHSLAALIDWADQAMYAAKQAGRNRVEIYE